MGTSERQKLSLDELIARAAVLLLKESRYGTWVDARVDATSILGLASCGLSQSEIHAPFLRTCIRELHDRRSTSEHGVCWNQEIWDTSLATLAIRSVAPDEYKRDFKDIRQWLDDRFNEVECNFVNEPWESLWALSALLAILPEFDESELARVRKAVAWVLGKRTRDGLLISHHYLGLLLFVLGQLIERPGFSKREVRLFETAIEQGIGYLKHDHERKILRGVLWSNEAWSNGLILLGFAHCPKQAAGIFEDPDFNEFLATWLDLDSVWNDLSGWYDVNDTSGMLFGLAQYHAAREAHLRGKGSDLRSQVRKELAARVHFVPKSVGIAKMTLRPIWSKRDFAIKQKQICVIMPFSKPWSTPVFQKLKVVLERNGYEVVRPDLDMTRDVMEGVWKQLNESAIIIADCTDANPNVLYEVGIAHTIGKDVIFVSQKLENIPYDIHSKRVLQYNVENPAELFERHLPDVIDHVKRGLA